MKCVSPVYIKNPYNETDDTKKQTIVNFEVPCGNCIACKYNKRVEWTYRLKWESYASSSSWFITLTYNEDNVPYSLFSGEMILSKEHLQKFMKRLRKYDNKITKQNKIRYFAIGEYGTRFDRPHYHIILFNAADETIGHIANLWNYGFVKADPVTSARLHYVTKFHVLSKKNEQISYFDTEKQENVIAKEREVPEFSLMSRRPGIGYHFIKMNYQNVKDNLITFVNIDKFKIKLPKYYKDKIFNEDEKNILRINSYSFLLRQKERERERIKKLGIEDVDEYIKQSRLHKAKRIRLKQIERSLNKDKL